MKAKLLFCFVCLCGSLGCDTFTNNDNSNLPPQYQFTRVDLISSLSGSQGYGSSVALLDDWAFATASNCRHINQATEGVAVFKRTGESWIENQVLDNPDGLRGFACYVTAAGSYLATTAGAATKQVGGVVIYELVDDQWEVLQTIRPIDDESAFDFGKTISMSDDRLVVGNLGKSVYTYRRTGKYFELEQIISNPDESIRYFARDIDLKGKIMVVGAGVPGNHLIRAFYIYTFDGSMWTVSFKEQRPSEEKTYLFAHSVAVDKESIMIGSVSTEDGLKEGGVERFTTVGFQDKVVTAFDSSGVDHGLGHFMDADRDRIVVTERGLKRVKVFEKYEAGYVEVGVIENTLSESAFHHSDVEMNGNWLAVSNYFDRRASTYFMKKVR